MLQNKILPEFKLFSNELNEENLPNQDDRLTKIQMLKVVILSKLVG